MHTSKRGSFATLVALLNTSFRSTSMTRTTRDAYYKRIERGGRSSTPIKPGCGKRECARRVRQMESGKCIDPTAIYAREEFMWGDGFAWDDSYGRSATL